MADFLQTLVAAITAGSLLALIALGYTMVYGILKLINFAHSDVVTLGAWTSLTAAMFLLPRMGVDLAHPAWWAAPLVLVIAMIVCAVIGFGIERLAYKPIRRAPRLNALITAIGVSLLLQNAGQLQYTITDGVKPIAAGVTSERGNDPATIRLQTSVTIAAGERYVLKITPKGSPAPIDRVLTMPAGKYPAGADLRFDGTIGRAQSREASFQLDQIFTPLRLPFGKTPAVAPYLLPPVNIYPDYPRYVWRHEFQSSFTAPDGSQQPMKKMLNIAVVDVIIVIVTFVLLTALHFLIYHTRLGMAMRAVSFNTDYAALMGIPIDRVISITFVIGAVLAAAAGFLYSQKFSLQQTASYAWVLLGLRAFIAAVVGGIGNVRGAVLGGFLIAFVDAFGSFYGTYLFQNANSYSDVLMFGLLIAVLLIKPSGIFGSATREKV